MLPLPISFKRSLVLAWALLPLACRLSPRGVPAEARRGDYAALFFTRDEAEEFTTLLPPFSTGMGAAEFLPEEAGALAGFAGFPRRLWLPRPAREYRNGFFATYTDVDEAPRAKVFLLTGVGVDQQKATLALVSLDTLLVSADLSKKISSWLQHEAAKQGALLSQVSVVATHTHAGHGGFSENPLWQIAVTERYRPELVASLQEALLVSYRQALSSSKEVNTLSLRAGTVEGLSKLRWPGTLLYQQGMELRFSSADNLDQPRGCLQTFPVHPTWYGINDFTLSSDIAGYIEKSSKAAMGSECFFFNGAAGNISPERGSSLREYGEDFVARLKEIPEQQQSLASLSAGSLLLSLPAPRFNLKACNISSLISTLFNVDVLSALPRFTKITYLLLNRVLWIFVPGEPLADLQKSWEKSLFTVLPGIEHIRFIGTANDYVGYIVPQELYAQPHLESCTSFYGDQLGEVVLAALLKELPLKIGGVENR